MSQVPATPQTPAAIVAAPVTPAAVVAVSPPPISAAQIIAPAAAPAKTPTYAEVTAAAAATPGTASGAPVVNKGLQELGSYFGLSPEAAKDDASTTAALKPVLDLIAQGGAPVQQAPVQQAPVPQPVPVQQAPAAADFKFDDLNLGEDASPELVKAFRALGERSQAAIQAANTQAAAAQTSATATAQAYVNHQKQAELNHQQQVSDRALTHIDSLASPKYGVGAARTMVQSFAAEQVMRATGNLIRGMERYGQSPPIEQVVNAAILQIEGKLPEAAPVAAAPVIPALTPAVARGTAPAPAKSTGSAGVGGSLMSDPRFMEGARAILSRQR